MVDFRNLAVVLGIVLIGIIAQFGLVGEMNVQYGTSVGDEWNDTQNEIRNMLESNLTSLSGGIGTSIEAKEGATEETTNAVLAARGLKVITKIPSMMGLISKTITVSAGQIGIPASIAQAGIFIFVLVFSITFGLILIRALGGLIP